MNYARIEDGVVAEIIVVDGDPPLAERFHPSFVAACVIAPDGVEVGWTYSAEDGFEATHSQPLPAPTVPRTVTNFQARTAMMQVPAVQTVGVAPGSSLFTVVNAALSAGKNATSEGAVAWNAWEYANDFYRDGALINQLAAGFGQSPAEIDALFIAASTIEA